MDESQIERLIQDFAEGAQRALDAGFDTLEIHAAHGYLLHEFMSPLSNQRDDDWGGSEDKRFRLPLEVITAVRGVIPEGMPLLLRVSASDWLAGGLDAEVVQRFAQRAKERGADMIDVSSGGLLPAEIPVSPGYQTAFAALIRRKADLPTAAVGMIIEAAQAEHIVTSGQADAVMLGRVALRDPHWWLRAAQSLGIKPDLVPQYERAVPSTGS